MESQPERIIKNEARCLACDVHTTRIHHRTFPELQVEGLSADTAVRHLVNRLSAALDSAHDTAERKSIQEALTETRTYLSQIEPQPASVDAPKVSSAGSSGPEGGISEVINILSEEPPPAGLLAKNETLEVRLLKLSKGREIPPHKAAGSITVHCLSGRIAFTACGKTHELGPNQLLVLSPGEPHSLVGLEASVILVTKHNPARPSAS